MYKITSGFSWCIFVVSINLCWCVLSAIMFQDDEDVDLDDAGLNSDGPSSLRTLRKREEKPSAVKTFIDDAIQDLPTEALMCTSHGQFSSKMKPILLAKLPAATSAELNSIITTKWRALKEARKQQAGQLGAFAAAKISNDGK